MFKVHFLNTRLVYVLYFIFSWFCSGQDLKVEYSTVFTLSMKKVENLAKENNYTPQQIMYLKDFVRNKYNAIENQKIILNTIKNDYFSIELPSSLESDFNRTGNIAPPALDLFDKVYSVDKGKVIGVNEDEQYAIAFQQDQVTWEVTDDSKIILGFKCFKATPRYKTIKERQFARSYEEVWFTPSINKRGGPLVYTNLPGLILEVKLKDAIITATNISSVASKQIKKTTKPIITEMQAHNRAKATSAAIESRIKN